MDKANTYIKDELVRKLVGWFHGGPVGDIQVKPMFGSFGLYLEGKFFAIVADGRVYFKTNDKTREKYVAAGMKPFQATPLQVLKNYYEVPAEVLNDREVLANWAIESSLVGLV